MQLRAVVVALAVVALFVVVLVAVVAVVVVAVVSPARATASSFLGVFLPLSQLAAFPSPSRPELSEHAGTTVDAYQYLGVKRTKRIKGVKRVKRLKGVKGVKRVKR